MSDLPSPTKGAADVAKLTIGIAGAIAGIFLPGAGAIGPIANFAIEKLIKRPEKLLLSELRSGKIEILTEERAATFIPMAYRFFEAAKQGEYEHILKLLAEFLKSELQMEEPNPSNFARMAKRVEGLSLTELKVIALINASLSEPTRSATKGPPPINRPFVSARQLANDPNNREGFDHLLLQEALTELASRALLIGEGASRFDKAEEYYFASTSFGELIEKARSTIEGASRGQTSVEGRVG
jgi:hypothetical protein